jgi:hypothetical protein
MLGNLRVLLVGIESRIVQPQYANNKTELVSRYIGLEVRPGEDISMKNNVLKTTLLRLLDKLDAISILIKMLKTANNLFSKTKSCDFKVD